MQRHFPDPGTAAVAVLLLVLPFLLPSATLASEIAVFAAGTLSVTVLLCSVGLLSFGQGLYFGVGAYMAGILLRDGGVSLLPALLAATVASALLAAALGFLAVRRRGVYFVMITLAFAQMGYFSMLALRDWTGGENGLDGVPAAPLLPGLAPLRAPGALYAVVAVLCLLAYAAAQRTLASPFGSVLTAIRENEDRAQALGYDVRRYKVAISAFAGAIGGLAGGLQALYLGFVPPTSIDLPLSERLLVMAILGGSGAPFGAFLGALAYALLSEVLTPIWPRWLILLAVVLIGIVLFLRGGLLGGIALAMRARAARD